MSDDPEVVALELLTDTLRRMQATQSTLVSTLRELSPHVEEHGDAIVALSNRIESNYRAVRPLLVTKGNLSTMTCGNCGSEYATEDGPELCGPCWVRLGMPDEWPTPRASRA